MEFQLKEFRIRTKYHGIPWKLVCIAKVSWDSMEVILFDEIANCT